MYHLKQENAQSLPIESWRQFWTQDIITLSSHQKSKFQEYAKELWAHLNSKKRYNQYNVSANIGHKISSEQGT